MNATLRAEWLKQCTTRTMFGVLIAMLGTVSLAAGIHLLGFGVALIDQRSEQLGIMLDIGVGLGLIFAAVGGAIAITSEFRYGTIRSNLMRRPNRTETLLAKVVTQLLIGAVLSAAAATTAIGLAVIFLRIRNVDLLLTNSDVARLILGGSFGGAMFALIGLAVGTLVRNQVPVVVGALVWTLFIETLLRAGMPARSRANDPRCLVICDRGRNFGRPGWRSARRGPHRVHPARRRLNMHQTVPSKEHHVAAAPPTTT
jgi:ABC-2 type transport system permease protein